MRTVELLSYLRRQGVRLWVEGERLRYSAPQGALTPDLLARIAERKAEIIAFLRRAAAHPAAPPIQPVPREGVLPLSFAQQRLWFLAQLMPDSSLYNMSAAVRLTGALDVVALERSLNAQVRRHEVLRTTFALVDGRPAQIIAADQAVPLPVLDLRGQPDDLREAEAIRIATAEARHPFDLSCGPLLRVALLQTGRQEHILTLTMHHIISDGWSIDIFIRELAALYAAYSTSSARQPAPLPALPVQYADFAVWQRQWLGGAVLEDQLAYWRSQLAGAPEVLALPLDRPRPAVPSSRGARQSFVLPAALGRQLAALAHQEECTLFMLLLAAFQTLLHRYSGQDDIVVGSPIAGRTRAQTRDLIGCFVNMLVLRTDLSGDPRFRELLRRVREICLGAYAHQDLPFERLVEELQAERDLSHTPLFQAVFSLQSAPVPLPELPGLTLSPVPLEAESVKFDLILTVTEGEWGLVGTFEYNTDLFDARTIAAMARHLETMLEGIAADPDRCVSALPLLTDAERAQLAAWNATEVDYPTHDCLHELVAAQAARAPDAVALVFEGQTLTYSELDRRANQLAHELQALSVGPDVPVALCMERSIELVVGLLGVLKAGGAYVPLDPEYPAERLRLMLADCQAPVLLMAASPGKQTSRQADKDTVGPEGFPFALSVIDLIADWPRIAQQPAHPPASGVALSNLSYIIYTSGSTGVPKGAMVPHEGICNRLRWMQETYQLTASDRVLQKTPYSFDVSVWEFFWPLIAGAPLVLARPGGHRDPGYLIEIIRSAQITTLHFVPSMLQMFVDEPGVGGCTSLRQVICSGEALPAELQARFFSRLGHVALHNLYGPTEASVDVTFWACRPGAADEPVPIGRPVANTQIWLLDDHLQPVPVGVPGELCIGGVQLARGYLNRPDLTAERFVPNPFHGERSEARGRRSGRSDAPVSSRLYRTGDLARFRSDGAIEFLGRRDFQVKLRGFRIELGEIEAVLAQHPAVRESLVVLQPVGEQPGTERLVAYLVPDERRAAPLRRLLRLQREGRLTDQRPYELPNEMVVLARNPAETEFMYREIFERQVYLRHGITLPEDACVFDVGANIGLFSLLVGQLCARAVVYAFEPVPEVFELLQLNLTLYGLDARPFACGLAETARTAAMTYYPYVSILSGRFASEQEERAAVRAFLRGRQELEGVSAADVDTLLAERLRGDSVICQFRTVSEIIREQGIERIDLLKVDVEKSELDVLAGIAVEDWPKIRQVVVEVHDIGGRVEQIQAALETRGYRVTVEQDTALYTSGLYNVYAIRPLPGAQTVRTAAEVLSDGREISSSTRLIREAAAWAREQLPEYMAPSEFVLLDALPLTPHGKVDRRALPPPDSGRSVLRAAFVAPETPIEQLLADIWAEVLRIDRVGIHDNFFALGGDSIRSVQVVAQARERGLSFSVQQLFQHQTIHRLAQTIGSTDLAPISASHTQPFSLIGPEDRQQLPVTVEDAYPLTQLQLGMLFHAERSPETTIYQNINSLLLKAHFDPQAIQAALARLIARHPVLRSSFDLTGYSEPLQLVHRFVDPPLQVVDIRQLSPAEQEQVLAAWFESEKRHAFQLARAPLIRFQVHWRSQTTFQFSWHVHHAILDGWSLASMLTELCLDYLFMLGEDVPPIKSAPRTTFREFVGLERQAIASQECRRYWAAKLADATVTKLPRWHTTGQGHHLRQVRLRAVPLPSSTSDGLQRLATAAGVPLKSVLLAGHLRVLSLVSGQSELVTGLVTHGRPQTADGERVLGLFLNTLPFRLKLPGGTWMELIQETFAAERELLPFQRYPLPELQQLMDGQALSETAFNFTHFHVYQPLLGQNGVELIGGRSFLETNFTFSALFTLDPSTSQLQLSFEYDSTTLCEDQIDALSGFYRRALAAMAADSNQRYELCDLLAPEERRLMLEWNATANAYPHDQCLHGLIEAQMEQTPDAIAVAFEGERLTYRELDRRANQLAHFLRACGVGPDLRVGICMERSAALVVGLLGILKAGGAYVPLDPNYPGERLAFMLEDAQVAVLLTKGKLRDWRLETVTSLSLAVIDIDADWPTIAAQPDQPPVSRVVPDNLAYMIYTSGSIGRPKGVMISHRAIVNHLCWMQATFPLTAADRVLQNTSLSFDVSVWEIFGPLFAGAQIIMPRSDEHQDSTSLSKTISERQITILQLVPTLLQVLLDTPNAHRCTSLRHVFCGGEALSFDLQERFFATLQAQLHHMYGPTETTIDATYWTCERASGRRVVPIGRPLQNMQSYVLDSHLQPVPVGTPGELYLGGVGLARGYFNRPELTAERFVPNLLQKVKDKRQKTKGDDDTSLLPFTFGRVSSSDRLYRTGDIVRYHPDGNLEFLGRIDHQIKLRGFRIELREIEAVLTQHPAVQEAVVVVHEGVPGERRLIAYVIPSQEPPTKSQEPEDSGKDGSRFSAPGSTELRSFLKQRLPDYMLPAAFVLLDSLPLTPNGKLDRRALPLPDQGRPDLEVAFVGPRTPIEETLAQIWADVLKWERVGIHDDFFELGGQSLLSIQLIARIRAVFQIDLPLRRLYEAPNVAALAQAIVHMLAEQADHVAHVQQASPAAEVDAGLPQIIPDPRRRHLPFPLTDVQQVYWTGRDDFFDLSTCGANVVMEHEFFDLPADFLERFQLALRRLIDRHEMLRAIILADGQQQILAYVPPYQMEVIDLRGHASGAAEASLEDARRRMRSQKTPLDRWPLFEFQAYLLDDRRIRLLTRIELLLIDGTSRAMLNRELIRLLAVPSAPLPPLECSYRDYVLTWLKFQASPAYQRARDYWLELLPSLPPAPELPLNQEITPSTRSQFVDRDIIALDPAAWELVKTFAARIGLTPSSVVVAAFAEVLRAWSANPRFTIGVISSDRPPFHPQIGQIVGHFTNFMLLAVEDSSGTFVERARRLQEQRVTHLDYRYFSGCQVLQELNRTRNRSRHVAIPICFNSVLDHHLPYHMHGLEEAEAAKSTLPYGFTELSVKTYTPQLLLAPTVRQLGDGSLICQWQSVDAVFADGLMQRMLEVYVLLLRRLAAGEGAWQETTPVAAPRVWYEQWRTLTPVIAPQPPECLSQRQPGQATPPEQKVLVAPRDELEQQLAELWEEVLEIRPIGVTDHFFDLGGNSFLAVRLIARLQMRFGATLPLAALYEVGTVEYLARMLR
jgi:amino acid adenylation domain-containing protein/FkbM family methyltransferase